MKVSLILRYERNTEDIDIETKNNPEIQVNPVSGHLRRIELRDMRGSYRIFYVGQEHEIYGTLERIRVTSMG